MRIMEDVMAEIRTPKYSFENDYSELAHPEVLKALSDVGTKQFNGYGLDEFSARAAELIKSRISNTEADVHFIAGGTHANLVVLSSILRPYEAVIAPHSGHIFVHEAGAIESTGHKICTVPGNNGKLCAEEIDATVAEHYDEHMVKPRVVYISQSTESGTVYTKSELMSISECCKRNGLYLYLDGARLGAALNSPLCDMTIVDVSNLTDVFYIGATKNGALFGEAIVICNDSLKTDFRYHLKQRGAMLAKGAVVGLQFEALLKSNLYDDLAKRAGSVALRLANGIKEAGYSLLYPVETNMVFPLFPAAIAEKLHQLYTFLDWEKRGDKTAVRLVASWATQESIVDEFLADLRLVSSGA